MQICSKHPDPWIRKRANELMREAGLDVFDPTEPVPYEQFAQNTRHEWQKQRMFFRLSLCALVVNVGMLAALMLTSPQTKVVFVAERVVAPNGESIPVSQGPLVIPKGSMQNKAVAN